MVRLVLYFCILFDLQILLSSSTDAEPPQPRLLSSLTLSNPAGTQQFEVLEFSYPLSTNQVIAAMEKLGYKPAAVDDCAAAHTLFETEESQPALRALVSHPIVCLGTMTMITEDDTTPQCNALLIWFYSNHSLDMTYGYCDSVSLRMYDFRFLATKKPTNSE